jgi:hypothetical protein
MNINMEKIANVLSGRLPKHTPVGWQPHEEGGFVQFFVAWKNKKNPLQSEDGSIKLHRLRRNSRP